MAATSLQEVNSIRVATYQATMQCIQAVMSSPHTASLPITCILSRPVVRGDTFNISSSMGNNNTESLNSNQCFSSIPNGEDSTKVEKLADTLRTVQISSLSSADNLAVCTNTTQLSSGGMDDPSVEAFQLDKGSKDFRVTFPSAPLGVTVVRDRSTISLIPTSSALLAPVKVHTVVAGSQAQDLGIRIGR